MDYKAEIERTKAAFDLLLPYVQCDKDEFMATASADAKLAMLMNGWCNPMACLQRAFKICLLVCEKRQDSLKDKHRNVERNYIRNR